MLRWLSAYLLNVVVSIDQTFNALLGGNRDVTISGRMGFYRDQCAFCRFVCRWLDRIDSGHCQRAMEPDRDSTALCGWRGSLALLGVYVGLLTYLLIE